LNSNIYIFSRPIRSGKTTALQQWIGSRENVAGLLAPDLDGKRKIYDIRGDSYYDLELEGRTGPGIIRVGRFAFDAAVFDQGKELLQQALIHDPDWLVIDEVGKLEIESNSGLEPTVKEIIRLYQSGTVKGKLLLVIRDYLLRKAIMHYQLIESVTVSSLDRLP
jgi:nucleoside-triphosphatase THEP1